MPNTILTPDEAVAEIKSSLEEFVEKEMPGATEAEKIRLMWLLLGAVPLGETIQSDRPI